ncbi:MAG: AraC family transcriptional regulator [Parvularcula sp.]|jgi:AraC family transcriptional regulator|nr:AraC family transcriptional regulator [Parvularcula sp.]
MTSAEYEIDLRFRGDDYAREPRGAFAGRGFRIERVQMNDPLSFDYAWSGDTHYLALHDIVLSDGEVRADETHRSETLDLRDRLTFAPKGMVIEGWSSLAARRNSYVALCFSPDLLEEEGRPSRNARLDRPQLYFLDQPLRDTLRKIDRLMTEPSAADPLLAETLCMLAALELDQALKGKPAEPKGPRLSAKHLTTVFDYIDAHLAEPITLDILAGLTGLSRYHFARAFTTTTGSSPVQFVRERRIERAQSLLRTTDGELDLIAQAVGFAGPRQFANAFRRQVGQSPTAYRRTIKA